MYAACLTLDPET